MQDRRHVRIVEIQCMTSDSVYKCGVGHAQPVGVPSAVACACSTAKQLDTVAGGDPRGGLLGARDGETEVVEQATGAFVQ